MMFKKVYLFLMVFIFSSIVFYNLEVSSQNIAGNVAVASPGGRTEGGGVDCTPCFKDTCNGGSVELCKRECKVDDIGTIWEFSGSRNCHGPCVIGGGKPSDTGMGNNDICLRDFDKRCEDGDKSFCITGHEGGGELIECVTNSKGRYTVKKCDDNTAGGPAHCDEATGECVQDIA
ncbi:MAG: hypothetical protein Q8Q42_04080 [Nanoarchaeota archaeon]|nr:hypothetical protein [Nanoarchaeota archaeon]